MSNHLYLHLYKPPGTIEWQLRPILNSMATYNYISKHREDIFFS